MKFWVVILSVLLSACEQTFNLTSPSPTTSLPTPISVTNTNTNTNNIDRTGSDTTPVPQTPTPTPNEQAVIPLPVYGEEVVRSVAKTNPTLLANSCQEKFGESAWAFLDLVIRTLQQRDSRWGYLCKNAECSAIARDVVAYRASASNTGIWIVDVIGNHCPLPGDVVEVRWGVLPFETIRPWTGMRK
jgi:hypothetical protein